MIRVGRIAEKGPLNGVLVREKGKTRGRGGGK